MNERILDICDVPVDAEYESENDKQIKLHSQVIGRFQAYTCTH